LFFWIVSSGSRCFPTRHPPFCPRSLPSAGHGGTSPSPQALCSLSRQAHARKYVSRLSSHFPPSVETFPLGCGFSTLYPPSIRKLFTFPYLGVPLPDLTFLAPRSPHCLDARCVTKQNVSIRAFPWVCGGAITFPAACRFGPGLRRDGRYLLNPSRHVSQTFYLVEMISRVK